MPFRELAKLKLKPSEIILHNKNTPLKESARGMGGEVPIVAKDGSRMLVGVFDLGTSMFKATHSGGKDGLNPIRTNAEYKPEYMNNARLIGSIRFEPTPNRLMELASVHLKVHQIEVGGSADTAPNDKSHVVFIQKSNNLGTLEQLEIGGTTPTANFLVTHRGMPGRDGLTPVGEASTAVQYVMGSGRIVKAIVFKPQKMN